MFNFADSWKAKLERLVNISAASKLTDEQFIVKEIKQFKNSKRRKEMLDGERYFDGCHDILARERTVIGKNGDLEVIKNLPNNRIVDNQYKKMVIQKTNYLLGQPFTIQADNDAYGKILKQFLNKKFLRTLKAVGEDSLNCGIGWLFPMYDDKGRFVFKRFRPWEIIPGWKDAEHTELEYFIRIYEVAAYVGNAEKVIEKVEVYDESGVSYFELTDGGKLVPDGEQHVPYFSIEDQGFNWTKIPLIAFKYNSKEIPLIKMVKSLQDGLNLIESNFQNQMEEDTRNTIMVLVNYDGQNLAEFRKNLATYGAVKVRSADGANGDVRTLQVEVNADNYKAIIELFKKAIIENAMGYDAKDDRMNGTPNQMNIQSMYSDIDLDANSMETEYQASFEDLLWFLNMHLFNTGAGDFENEGVEIIFNRDMMLNEGEVIDNIAKSVGIISDETLITQHPWVDDAQTELDRIKTQKEENMEQYQLAFNDNNLENEEEV
ncbi:MAG: phage portal protein [Lachnospiraceae bacterium]|nr:phage portal protein [Lachnospiraceae bacterium]